MLSKETGNGFIILWTSVHCFLLVVEFNSGLLNRGDDELAEVEAELVGFSSFTFTLLTTRYSAAF